MVEHDKGGTCWYEMQRSGMQCNTVYVWVHSLLERSRSRMKPIKCSLILICPRLLSSTLSFIQLRSPILSCSFLILSNFSPFCSLLLNHTNFPTLFSHPSPDIIQFIFIIHFQIPFTNSPCPSLSLFLFFLLIPFFWFCFFLFLFFSSPSLSKALSPVYWCSQRTHRAEQPSPPS